MSHHDDGEFLQSHMVKPTLNLLEFLASSVTIYITILQMGQESHILAFTYSSSALGCMYKASLDPVNVESHDVVARWMGWTLVSNETSLYSQHINVTEKIIAYYLSQDFHMSDQTLTKFSTKSYHHRQRHRPISNSCQKTLSTGYHC